MSVWATPRPGYAGRDFGTSRFLLAIFAGIVMLPLEAADTSYFLGYRGEYTTNVDRVPVNARDEHIHSLLAGFTYVDASPVLNVRVAPSVEYLHYANGTNEDETRLTLDAYILWAISPQRATWTLEDNVRQVRANATQTDTPSNIVTANVLSTGPDFYLRFGPVNRLQLGARFGTVYVEDSEDDNQRRLGYARWIYQASPLTMLSLNYEASTVEFQNETLNPTFSRQDYFIRVQSKLGHSTFDLDLGGTTIKRDGGGVEDGSLARVAWTRIPNTGTTLGVAAESSYGDTGTDLAATATAANTPAPGSGVTTSQNLVARDIFYAKRGTVFYQRLDSLLVTDLRLSQSNLEFEAVPLDDREETGGVAALTYLYSGTISAGIFADRKKTRYLNVTQLDTDTNYGLRFSYRMTRRLTATLGVSKTERESTDPASRFVDERVFVTLLYGSASSQSR